MEQEQEQNPEQGQNHEGFNKTFKGIVSACRSYISGHRYIRVIIAVTGVIALLLALLSVPLYLAPAVQHTLGRGRNTIVEADSALLANKDVRKQLSRLKTDITRLERRQAIYMPTQNYLVINTTDNRFFLYRNRTLVREGFCSSGSYTLLRTEDGEKQWIFKTPKGRFTIQGKITDPVWHKPDWAFVEEGLPVPSQSHPSRYEYGVLGDYALSLGDGYLIHGTLYKRFLGMPVTHGCIRLNDDDLEAVYNALSIGSKVYIY